MKLTDDSIWETKRQKLINLLREVKTEIPLENVMIELEYVDKWTLVDDINSIVKVLKKEGKQILIRPPSCIACGYLFKFKDRKLKIPSKCPHCHEERILWPVIKITEV